MALFLQAQAILLLARNGVSVASNIAQTELQAPGDGVPVSQPANAPASSGHPSPISISSHTGAQSGSGSTSTNEFLAVKTTGVPITPVSNAEPPRVIDAITMLASGMLEVPFLIIAVRLFCLLKSCLGIFVYILHIEEKQIHSTHLIISLPIFYAAIPQARKASLARFLEKRKERLVLMPFLYKSKIPS